MEPTREPPMEQERQRGEQVSTHRLLYALVALLGIVAIALLVVLVWLLRPQPTSTAVAAKGCPMDITRSIYGFGTKPGELLVEPLAVAFDGAGNVWVSDTGNARVVEFGPDGKLIRSVGDDGGPGRLHSPYGLSFSNDFQRLYVADWTRREVLIFSAEGRYVQSLPAGDQDLAVFGPDGFSPYDIAVRGAQIVVASNDGLYFFDRSGYVVDRWGGETRGSDVGSFAFPDALAIDPTTGNVYVADTLNRRVIALDGDGNVLWVSGERDEQGKIVGFWQLPRSVVVGPDGLVYVTDTFRAQDRCAGVGHIVVLKPTGELVSEFGAAGRSEDTLSFPEKMAIGPDGTFAIADRENNRVVVFTVGPLPPADPGEASLYEKSFVRFGQ
ncbi:serine/threonine-protein kinase PknD [bacterium BMS3Bbin01]|nr:serine/threonine-protein kinase PknD [bacterium BMS3Bbin01]